MQYSPFDPISQDHVIEARMALTMLVGLQRRLRSVLAETGRAIITPEGASFAWSEVDPPRPTRLAAIEKTARKHADRLLAALRQAGPRTAKDRWRIEILYAPAAEASLDIVCMGETVGSKEDQPMDRVTALLQRLALADEHRPQLDVIADAPS